MCRNPKGLSLAQLVARPERESGLEEAFKFQQGSCAARPEIVSRDLGPSNVTARGRELRYESERVDPVGSR